jgi:hypothetical protein
VAAALPGGGSQGCGCGRGWAQAWVGEVLCTGLLTCILCTEPLLFRCLVVAMGWRGLRDARPTAAFSERVAPSILWGCCRAVWCCCGGLRFVIGRKRYDAPMHAPRQPQMRSWVGERTRVSNELLL